MKESSIGEQIDEDIKNQTENLEFESVSNMKLHELIDEGDNFTSDSRSRIGTNSLKNVAFADDNESCATSKSGKKKILKYFYFLLTEIEIPIN